MLYVPVCKGLLDAKHRERIGVALWEYLWCLDRASVLNAEGMGLVLGGKPLKLADIALGLGVSEMTVSRNLHKLAQGNYLVLVHAPYGIVIKVPRIKKTLKNAAYAQAVHRFNRSAEPRFIKNDEPPHRSVEPCFISVGPNKRIQYENTVRRASFR